MKALFKLPALFTHKYIIEFYQIKVPFRSLTRHSFSDGAGFRGSLILICLPIAIGMAWHNEANAQTTQFQRIYGGADLDKPHNIIATADGGYAYTGDTKSFGAGNRDLLVSKVTATGEIEWTKTFGGTDIDAGYTIIQKQDGGYLIGGETRSFGAGNQDLLFIRLDVNGNILWKKTHGLGGFEYARITRETRDGGLISTGYTTSAGLGGNDILVVKMDSMGAIEWTRAIGLPVSEFPHYLDTTENGGFIITGYRQSGAWDVYLLKLDSLGNVEWTKTIGGGNLDLGFGVQQVGFLCSSDKGFVVVARTNSFGAGGNDILVFKTDGQGNLIWAKTYGGAGNDEGYTIIEKPGSGYLITGITNSFGQGATDIYLIETDSLGNLLNSKTFGGPTIETVFTLDNNTQITPDGGIVIAGQTGSFGFGSDDVYIIKTDTSGISGCNETANVATITGTPTLTVTDIFPATGTPALFTTDPPLVNTTPAILDSVLCAEFTVDDIDLKTASEFALLSGGNIISSDSIFAIGSVGAIGTVSNNIIAESGVFPSNDPSVQQAIEDLNTAINIMENIPGTTIPENLGGQALAAGVYDITGHAVLDGTLILNGDSSSIFVFRVSDSLTIKTNALLDAGNVLTKNIYWNIMNSQSSSNYILIEDSVNFSGILITASGNTTSRSFNSGRLALLSANGNIALFNNGSTYSSAYLTAPEKSPTCIVVQFNTNMLANISKNTGQVVTVDFIRIIPTQEFPGLEMILNYSYDLVNSVTGIAHRAGFGTISVPPAVSGSTTFTIPCIPTGMYFLSLTFSPTSIPTGNCGFGNVVQFYKFSSWNVPSPSTNKCFWTSGNAPLGDNCTITKVMTVFVNKVNSSPLCNITNQLTQLSNLDQHSQYSDIWGFVETTFNREFALMGSLGGVSFIDVTFPGSPVEVGFVTSPPGPFFAHKDIKTYYHAATDKHYAYITSTGTGAGNGLVIVDLSDLAQATLTPNTTITDADVVNRWTDVDVVRTHNVFIDQSSGKLFLCGNFNGAGNTPAGIVMLDIATDPENPTILDKHPLIVHDMYLLGDIVYACANDIALFDVSSGSFIHPTNIFTPTDPLVIPYPANQFPVDPCTSGSNNDECVPHPAHNLWFNEDGQYMVSADENEGGEAIFWRMRNLGKPNVNDLRQIDKVDAINNANFHNLFIRGNYAYASAYALGLIVYDMTNPYDIREIGRYDTYTPHNSTGFVGAWGVYPFLPSCNILVSDIQTGLHVIGLPDAVAPPPSFEVDPLLDISVGQPVSFTNTTSIEVVPRASYTWDFGDGTSTVTTDIPEIVNHTYDLPGWYRVTMTAANNPCDDGSMSVQDIYVAPSTPGYNPGGCIQSYTNYLNLFGDFNHTFTDDPSETNTFLSPISNPVIWDGLNLNIKGTIRIKTGAKLILQNNTILNFGPQAKVIVEDGAELVVNASTLTSIDYSSVCGIPSRMMWQGVEVFGNATSSNPADQGKIILENAALIEDAHNGVMLGMSELTLTDIGFQYNGHVSSSGGGIIDASNSTFNRNGVSVRFWEYDSHNSSSITNCIFTCKTDGVNSSLLDPYYNSNNVDNYSVAAIKAHNPFYALPAGNPTGRSIDYISQYKVKNVFFQDNNFDYAQVGMRSYNAKYDVTGGSFNNVKEGIRIDATLSDYFGHTISGVQFKNFETGILIFGGKYDKIHGNTFNPPPFTIGSQFDNFFGITMFFAGNFDIVDNEFNLVRFGVTVAGSGSTSASLIGLETGGNIFTQCNQAITTLVDNSMLDMRCNTFDNSDQSLYGGKNWDIDGILKDQGMASTAQEDQAGNIFNLPNPSINKEIDANTSPPFYYYHHLDDFTEPDKFDVSISTFTKSQNNVSFTTLLEVCGDPCQTGLIACRLALIDDLQAAKTTLEQEFAVVESNLDKGNTAALLSAIGSNMPSGQLKDTLVNNSPLSNNVIIAYSQKPLAGKGKISPGNYKEVMLLNCPVSEEVRPHLESKLTALPNGIANQLREAQASNAVRTLTAIEREIVAVETRRQLQVNRAIRELVNTGDNAAAIQLLENETNKAARQTLVATYIDQNDFASATSKLNTLPVVTDEDIAFRDLYGLYIDLFSFGKTLWDMDAAQEQLVRAIAAQCPETLPVVNARAVLEVVFGEFTLDCPQPQFKTSGNQQPEITAEEDISPGSGSQQTEIKSAEDISTDNVPPYTSANYPDPFKAATYIPYFVPSTSNRAVLKVFNTYGSLLQEIDLRKGSNTLEIRVPDLWAEGVYFYSIEIDGVKKQFEKMVLIR